MWLWREVRKDCVAVDTNYAYGVVWRVEVLSVPAGWEEDVRTDATSAGLLGQFDGIQGTGTRVRVGGVGAEVGVEASVGNGPALRCVGAHSSGVATEWVSDDHPESLEYR